MSDNAQQIEYWNGPGGQRWAKMQDTMDRNLAAMTEVFMGFVDAKPGARVLDIGCGGGTTSFMIARAVGESGSVKGVDISVPILDVARARAKASPAKVEFIEADASTHAFRPEFDLVISRFGVMFFADPTKAFANIHKALKPGGRMAFMCWRAMPENPAMFGPLMAARDLLPPQEPFDPIAPGPFAFADAERLKSILTAAGFRDIRIDRLDSTMYVGSSADEAATVMMNIGPLARATAELDEPTRRKIHERAKQALAKYQTPAGITPPAACWLVGAGG